MALAARLGEITVYTDLKIRHQRRLVLSLPVARCFQTPNTSDAPWLRAMKLKEAAKKIEDGIEETLTYCDFPSEHWTHIRPNNVIEQLNLEIRRRTRVVEMFPDGNSALMLVCARLRYVAGTQWGNKKYMNMKHLEAVLDDASIVD